MMPESVTNIYFHGIPGNCSELALFGQWGNSRMPVPFVAERGSMVFELEANRYFDRLADEVKARFSGGRLRFVGFSLGAVAALQVAHRLGDQVIGLDLISAAAPLSTGNYLPQMAGRRVFEIARRHPLAFRTFVKMQSIAVRVAPNLLYKALFATALGADEVLKDDRCFKEVMLDLLRTSLTIDTAAYYHEILFYVQDWSPILAQVSQPVTLWHGTTDNWSPPDMAIALARSLPNCTHINWIEGASHYSTLHAFLDDLRTGTRF